MKKIIMAVIFILLGVGFPNLCFAQSECERAKGRIVKATECDGSENEWCIISEQEQCYADQVVDGQCTVGKYSEALKGIVGITPKVLCDSVDDQ